MAFIPSFRRPPAAENAGLSVPVDATTHNQPVPTAPARTFARPASPAPPVPALAPPVSPAPKQRKQKPTRKAAADEAVLRLTFCLPEAAEIEWRQAAERGGFANLSEFIRHHVTTSAGLPQIRFADPKRLRTRRKVKR